MNDKLGPKYFVFDSSVLVHDPFSIHKFGEKNKVLIHIVSVEEIDKLKKSRDERGLNCREISRQLLALKDENKLGGPDNYTEHKVSILYGNEDFSLLPPGFERSNDNRIIMLAIQLQNSGKNVVYVSQDANTLIKAAAFGIKAEVYKTDRLIDSLGSLYSGRTDLYVDDPAILNDLARNKSIGASLIASEEVLAELNPNQCCSIRLRENGKTLLAIYKKAARKFNWVTKPKLRDMQSENGEIRPANDEQAFAFALLNDPEIYIATLVGKAGTGKTLMALLSGYEQIKGETGFEKIVVYRPNIPVGDSLGFKPGTIEEKFRPHTRPILDNLDEIMRPRTEQQTGDKQKMRTGPKDLIDINWLEISPIEDVRGRSIKNSLIIVDEAQNLTPHVIKTLVTRAGRGSKVVLNGDPSQIDRLYLDSVSNGLVYTVEKFKGHERFGHITLLKGERSELAEIAANLL